MLRPVLRQLRLLLACLALSVAFGSSSRSFDTTRSVDTVVVVQAVRSAAHASISPRKPATRSAGVVVAVAVATPHVASDHPANSSVFLASLAVEACGRHLYLENCVLLC